MSRIAVGESVRVVCHVRFIVRQQPGSEDIAELQYYEKVHVNHGPDAKVIHLSSVRSGPKNC